MQEKHMTYLHELDETRKTNEIQAQAGTHAYRMSTLSNRREEGIRHNPINTMVSSNSTYVQ